LARNTDVRFTSDASLNFSPFWSPNADRIAFRSNRRRSPGDLYQKAASGSGEDELLLSTPNPKLVNQWSRDGRIVFTETDPKTKEDLWVLPSGQGEASFGVADRRPVKILNTEFREFQGQISPDGHWMAYTSDETRQREVYVRPFPASEGKLEDFDCWRRAAALAGRRQGTLLCGSGRKADGSGGESVSRGKTLLRIGGSRAAV
jgi:Tol biopolymer transport system component